MYPCQKVKKDYTFVNWAGNHRCQSQALLQPSSEEEVLQLLRWALEEERQIRVVGAGHSWSPLACSRDILVNLDHLSSLKEIDMERHQATVEAGIRLKDLNRVLGEEGLALPNLGSVAEQSLAGAISTGTHGSGIDYPILSALVKEATLVTGRGEVLKISEEENSELLPAAPLSLGALGILTELKIQCEPSFYLEENSYPLPFEEGLEKMDSLVDEHEHLKAWWLPHTDWIQIYTYNRTEKKGRQASGLPRWIDNKIVNPYLFRLLLWMGYAFSHSIPLLNRLVRRLYFRPVQQVDLSYQLFNIAMPPPHLEVEYAVARKKGASVLREMRDLIDRENLHVNFIAELRFVKGDNFLLSPAYQRDSCYIGAYTYWGKSQKAYFEGFEKIARHHQGRPHWAKEFDMDSPALHQAFPGLEEFKKLRRRLDPQGIFLNSYLKEIFDL